MRDLVNARLGAAIDSAMQRGIAHRDARQIAEIRRQREHLTWKRKRGIGVSMELGNELCRTKLVVNRESVGSAPSTHRVGVPPLVLFRSGSNPVAFVVAPATT